ncbi:SPOR domain-containing protein [Bordetella tumulicola]|uniref:SPOR domain-containing protein n=1 Tax=Bordetella tumulicola TaxID=1649133 RepID=UPI0039F01E4B
MGLFTRKDSASQASPSRPRPSVSSEAQAAELRGRARRRLAGAVALVLAAVIVLPMVLDSEPVPVANDIPIRIPDRNAPYQPQVSPPAVADAGSAATGTTPGDASGQTPATQSPATPSTPPDLSSVQPPEPTTSIAETELSKPPAVPPPVTKPPVTPPKPPATPPKTARDDDGARALALLEGRAAPEAPARAAPKPATKGNFVLQIASYGAQADAQSRRTKLHQAGVTNAFVEEASVGGKQQYRLRVGPFPSREAAQAAQARLRTLGYDNGFITGQ